MLPFQPAGPAGREGAVIGCLESTFQAVTLFMKDK